MQRLCRCRWPTAASQLTATDPRESALLFGEAPDFDVSLDEACRGTAAVCTEAMVPEPGEESGYRGGRVGALVSQLGFARHGKQCLNCGVPGCQP